MRQVLVMVFMLAAALYGVEADAGIYLREYTDQLEGGTGFDPTAASVGDRVKGFRCYNTVRLPDLPGVPRTIYTAELYESAELLREGLDVSVAAEISTSFGVGTLRAEGAVRSSSAAKFSSNTVVLVVNAEIRRVDSVYEAMPGFSQTGLVLLSQVNNKIGDYADDKFWYTLCGREFVTRIKRVQRASVVYRFEQSSKEQSRSLAARAKVIYNSISTDGQLDSDLRREWTSIVSRSRASVNFETTGGPGVGALVGNVSDVLEVWRAVNSYVSNLTNEDSAHFAYQTSQGDVLFAASWLEQGQLQKYGILLSNEHILDSLMNLFRAAQATLTRIDDNLANESTFEKYPPLGGIEALETVRDARGAWTSFRDDVVVRGRACLQGEVQGGPPGADCTDAGLVLPNAVPVLLTGVPLQASCVSEPSFEYTDVFPKRQWRLLASVRVINRLPHEISARWSNFFRDTTEDGARSAFVSEVQPVAKSPLGSTGTLLQLLGNYDFYGCKPYEGINSIVVRDFDGSETPLYLMDVVVGSEQSQCDRIQVYPSCPTNL